MPNYEIRYSDNNENRQITVLEQKFYGQTLSVTQTRDPGAVDISKNSLTLYGMDTPNYGEKIQENLIYLLENFAGLVAPGFPVPGQLWFDRNDNTLRLFDSRKHQILSSVNTGNNSFVISIYGNNTDLAYYTAMAGQKIRVTTPDDVKNPVNIVGNTFEREVLVTIDDVSVPYITGNVITMLVGSSGLIGTVSIAGWYIGGWRTIAHGSTEMDDIDARNLKIVNVADPINVLDAVNKQYADAISLTTSSNYYTKSAADNKFVDLLGDTMSGFLVLNDDPVLALHAATKQYVDANLGYDTITADNRFVHVAGDDMTGYLKLHANPVQAFHAATKQYVDNAVSAGSTSSLSDLNDVLITSLATDDIFSFNGVKWRNLDPALFYTSLMRPLISGDFLALSGGTVTGHISLPLAPDNPVYATNKQYVDDGDAGLQTQVDALSSVVSGEFNDANLKMTLHQSSGELVDIPYGPSLRNVINKAAGKLDRALMVADGIATVFDFSTVNPNMSYVVDSNKLAVFVAGLKKVSTERGLATVSMLTTPITYAVTYAEPYGLYLSIDGDHAIVFPTDSTRSLVRPIVTESIDVLDPGATYNISTGTTDIPLVVSVALDAYPIVGIAVSLDSIDITGSVASYFPAGIRFNVFGSTDNDGVYIVDIAGATEALGVTTIPITTAFTSTTADGDVTTVTGDIAVSQGDTLPLRVTGLDVLTAYTFDITVDGGTPTTLSVTGETFADLIFDINRALVDATLGASCVLMSTGFQFISDSTGPTSSIVVADSGGNPLFGSITGTDPYPVALDAITNFTPSANMDYYEVGSPGTSSTTITFYSAPANLAVLEFLIL